MAGINETYEIEIVDSFSTNLNSFISLTTSAIDIADRFAESLDDLNEATRDFSDALGGNNTANEFYSLEDSINSVASSATSAFEEVSDLDDAFDDAADDANRFTRELDDANSSTQRLARSGVNPLTKEILKLVSAYRILRYARETLTEALERERLEIQLQVRFGDELVGTQAYNWVRQVSNELGRATQDVANATNRFLASTTNPELLRELTTLADRFAYLSQSGSFANSANAISTAFRTGNLRTLSSETGIAVGTLESFGVKEAAQANDVRAFTEALTAAAEAVGITQDAYDKFLDSSGSKWRRFVNTFKNGAVDAARGFIRAFEPAFDEFDAFANSDAAKALLNGLEVAFTAVGNVVAFVVKALTRVATIIADNIQPIAIVASIAVLGLGVAFAGLAASAILANAPLLLVIGTIAAFTKGAVEAGATVEEAFAGVARFLASFAVFFINTFISIYNAVSDVAYNLTFLFDNPLESILRTLSSFADAAFGIFQGLAGAIDAVFGSNIKSAVAGWRETTIGAQKKILDYHFGVREDNPNRMDEIDEKEFVDKAEELARELGRKLDDFNPDEWFGDFSGFNSFDGIDSIGGVGTVGNVKSVGDVSLSDETLRYLEDIETRKYLNRVNVQLLSPDVQLTINANNADGEQAVARIGSAVREILETEVARYTNVNYADAY